MNVLQAVTEEVFEIIRATVCNWGDEKPDSDSPWSAM